MDMKNKFIGKKDLTFLTFLTNPCNKLILCVLMMLIFNYINKKKLTFLTNVKNPRKFVKNPKNFLTATAPANKGIQRLLKMLSDFPVSVKNNQYQ